VYVSASVLGVDGCGICEYEQVPVLHILFAFGIVPQVISASHTGYLH